MSLTIHDDGLVRLSSDSRSWCRRLSSPVRQGTTGRLDNWSRLLDAEPGLTADVEAHRSVLYASLNGKDGPWTFWRPDWEGGSPHLAALHGVLCPIESEFGSAFSKRLRKGLPELAQARRLLSACSLIDQ